MKYIHNRKYFLKQLYYNAGKSVVTSCYTYAQKYIDHKKLNKLYNRIICSPVESDLYFCDIYGACFNALCKRLLSEKFYNTTTITILDPHFSTDVICGLYIPRIKVGLYNNYNTSSACKAFNLYTANINPKSDQDILISKEFFNKSYQYK